MKGLIALLLLAAIFPTHAGVVIYGTRVIYPAEKKEVVVQLMNQGEQASLVQSWIDDGDSSLAPEKIQVPFLLTPPVVRIGGGSGQQLKIRKMPNTLPENKESLFYLNVLAIPPNAPGSENTSTLKFALQNRLKLFYRPKGIAAVNKASFEKIHLIRQDNALSLKNDTANWITIARIKQGDTEVSTEAVMLAPLSTQMLTLKNPRASRYNLTIIDDAGNHISENITVQ